MKEYKYQLHCHTTPCSGCGRIKPFELVQYLYKGGYSGAVLTNHFYNGNTGIDRELSWRKFVGFYEKDFLECKKYSENLGIDILFGVEEHIGNGQEILCYGLTPEMLYDHPELRERSLELWYNTLSPLGVLIIQAHPFRYRGESNKTGLLPLEFIDGIEVYNFGNSDEENCLANDAFSENPHFIVTSGADAHLPHVICHAGIKTVSRIKTSSELVQVLRTSQYELINE